MGGLGRLGFSLAVAPLLLAAGCSSDDAPQRYCEALVDAQATVSDLTSTLESDAPQQQVVTAAEAAMISANRIRDAAFDEYPQAANTAASIVEPFTFEVRAYATGDGDTSSLESALSAYQEQLGDLAAEGSC